MQKMYGMPAKEVQRSDQVSDVSQQAESSDLLVNNLSYHQPEALSLAVQRAYSRQFFQRNTYAPGETAVIDFNAGTDFVDPGNSYITFKVLLVGDAGTVNADFGLNGSAMNVIKQVTIKSRSGTELDRVESANLWSSMMSRYVETYSFLRRQGRAEGWRADNGAGATALATNQTFLTASAATTARFAIPLKRLAPFFNPVKKGQKIPPQLMSGLHMEIIWENYDRALVQGGGAGNITSYSVTDLAVMCDSVCMTDDVQRTINDQSANDGLEYAYPRVFTSIDTLGAVTALNSQVRKAVSQANIAFAIPQVAAQYTADLTADNMAAGPWLVSRMQYRLGALYYPIQALEDANVDGVEGYAQALETFDKYKHSHDESSVSYVDFTTNGAGIIAVSLEKDTALNFSGLPVNNSRVLESLVTFSTGVARQVTTFLEYSAVARSYVDNTAVSI